MGRNNGDHCAAINCSNSRTKKPDLSFFRFPKETERCKKWIANCQRAAWYTLSVEKIAGKKCLCEEHFEASQFMNPSLKGKLSKRKHLVHDALPTLFDVPNPTPYPLTVIAKPSTTTETTDTKILYKTDFSNAKPSVFMNQNVQVQHNDSVSNNKPAVPISLNKIFASVAEPEKCLLKPINSIHEIISPTIRFKPASNNIRTIKELRRLLRQKRQTIYRLKSKLAKVQENGSEKRLKRRMLQLFECVKDKIDDNLYYFLKAQLIRKVITKRKNWTCEELALPLAIYKTSRNAYRMLSKTLALPSTRTLQRYSTRKTDDVLTGMLESITSNVPTEKINCIKTNGLASPTETLREIVTSDSVTDIVEC